MKIGAMNDPRRDLLDEIRWISQNGFDFIDLTIEPLKAYEVDVSRIKDVIKECGLEVIGHTNPFLPSIFPIPSIREACLDELKRSIDIFAHLEVRLVSIHPFYNAPMLSDEDKIKANIEIVKRVNAFCRTRRMELMFENFVRPFDTPEIFSRIIDEVPKLKIHLDIGHCNLNQEGDSVEKFFKKFGKKIVHLHFSDNKGEGDDHLPLGCGNIDWERIVNIIKKYRFDRTITIEVFSQDRDYLLLSRDKLKEWLLK
jgi:sugar phosphate isomerase/epimerase